MAEPFLFIGDSLIEFFNWQERFPGRTIFNCGSAGETAEGLFARLPGITRQVQSAALVMIMTGINNVAMEDYGFLVTYEKIVAHLQQAYAQTTIVISSLLPADLYFLGDAVPRVNRRLQETALRSGAVYFDIYPLFIDDNSRIISSYFEPDGVHLSGAGYEVWANAIEETLFPLLKNRT
jgi:lysophospholipase L1-like esterase